MNPLSPKRLYQCMRTSSLIIKDSYNYRLLNSDAAMREWQHPVGKDPLWSQTKGSSWASNWEMPPEVGGMENINGKSLWIKCLGSVQLKLVCISYLYEGLQWDGGTTLPELNKALYSHASGSALWYMAVLPWVKFFIWKCKEGNKRKQCVTATDEYKEEKSPWGTRDRATTSVSFQWPTLLCNSELWLL